MDGAERAGGGERRPGRPEIGFGCVAGLGLEGADFDGGVGGSFDGTVDEDEGGEEVNHRLAVGEGDVAGGFDDAVGLADGAATGEIVVG